jgi:hypothetical protein
MLASQQMQDRRRKTESETQQKAALEKYISSLPVEQQAIARAFPEKSAEAMFRPVKQSVQTIYTPEGKETKVVFNESTGQFTPVGGTKAESFVQVDRGNVIELRRPSGEVFGTLPKGVSPTAPSYSWTDQGVLNTRTGQLTQPTDAKGNAVVLDQSVKASDGERLSAGFFARMSGASKELKQPITDAQGNPVRREDGSIVTVEDAAQRPEMFSSLVGGIVPNWMGGQQLQNLATSSVRQQYEQAQRNWVTANLRKESGAVIGVDEMKQEIIKYFPQIGDSDSVIAQKERSRQTTQDAMRRNAGRALSVVPAADVDLRSAAQKELDRRQGR